MSRSAAATRRVALAAWPALLAPRAARAEGARMVLLERHDCPWCVRWRREVGERAWNRSNLGRRAPLRAVDVATGLPEDLRFLTDWRVTPSFVLVAQGREIGRITGYQGDHFFWAAAEALIARLPPEG
ncbi:MAG: thioredoxin family protein [Rubritepida sp.]|jgi:hypothetical protein|nr:thioredoxin family protein [Rubritepida sp.]MCU0944529.1 thioredoxin family protein [Rubritepida sp.]